MRQRKFVIGQEARKLLAHAIEKRSPVTITVFEGSPASSKPAQRASNWRIYKSNFLGMHSNRIFLALPTGPEVDCQFEPAPGREIAVTFKKGYNK